MVEGMEESRNMRVQKDKMVNNKHKEKYIGCSK